MALLPQVLPISPGSLLVVAPGERAHCEAGLAGRGRLPRGPWHQRPPGRVPSRPLLPVQAREVCEGQGR
eukprot:15463281-Alexandrium_andersonii.AAC.1